MSKRLPGTKEPTEEPVKKDRLIPIYRQIRDTLSREIGEGQYAVGGRLPSEKELSQRFIVERNTVRRALQLLVEEEQIKKMPGYGSVLVKQDKSDPVGKENAAVGEPARLEDPQTAIRRNILMVTSRDYLQENPVETFHLRLLHLFEQAVSDRGYNLIYKSIGQDNHMAETLRHTDPAGVIFVSSMDQQAYRQVLTRSIPCVSVNHATPLMTSVVSNNAGGARAIARQLIEAGHRSILYITGKRDNQTASERLAGIRRLYDEKGLPFDSQSVKEGDWSYESGFAIAQQLLSLREADLPTAIFAFNDDMAYGCYVCLTQNGLSVPGQISLVGFDQTDRYTRIFPAITTVDVNSRALVDYTCWYLSESIRKTAPAACASIQIEAHVVDHGTIRPPV
jgi:LacI family transcriptional regulator